MPTAEEQRNLALIQRLYESCINQGNLDILDEVLAMDMVEHETAPGETPDREGVKRFFAMFLNAFPDLHFEVEDLFGSGDRVAARTVVRGTHKDEFMGMPPTGKKIEMNVIDLFRIEDGKVAEHWGLTDEMGMMRQLGAIPSEG